MKIPEQECGTVEMVSVEWLLQNIHYSVDGCNMRVHDGEDIDWPYLISYKNDGSLSDVVYTIQERGFRVPICLYPNPRGADWALGNGHHRMTASILLCLDEIPVFWSEHDYMSDSYTDTEGTLTNPDPDFNMLVANPF